MTFLFKSDDVRPDKFEITIEIYSYELCNTANNLLQSARKLAKHFSDFATFSSTTKRGDAMSHNHNQNSILSSQIPILFNASSHSSAYSMNRFCLIAKATLSHEDICIDEIPCTRHLILICGNNANANENCSFSSNSTASSLIVPGALHNQLPLFDYYSCLLKSMPSSSFI